jgi:hypothetical protein
MDIIAYIQSFVTGGEPRDTAGETAGDTTGEPRDTAGETAGETTGETAGETTGKPDVVRGIAYLPILNIEGANIPVFIPGESTLSKPWENKHVSHKPTGICFILDTSGSMGNAAKYLQTWIPKSLRLFGLPAATPYTLVTFASKCNTTHTTLSAAGTNIDNNSGGTMMEGVAKPLLQFLQSARGFTLIIVISDGDVYDTDTAVRELDKVVAAHPNADTCIIGIRWGISGNTRALTCIMNLNASSSRILTVPTDIEYDNLDGLIASELMYLTHDRICLSGASELPGGNHIEISCLNQDGMVVFVDAEHLPKLCANGTQIDISHQNIPIPKNILEKYCGSIIKSLRIRIVASLGMTEPIAQEIKALLELIDSVLGTPEELSTNLLESAQTETRLQKLVNSALAKYARSLHQLEDMTDQTVRGELVRLQRIEKLNGLTSNTLNDFLQGRSVCTSRGVAQRSKSADAIIEELRVSLLVLCDAIRKGDTTHNSESEHQCVITYETCGAAYTALTELSNEVIDSMSLEELFEFLGTLPGLAIRCEKGDYADPWRAVVTVYNIKNYLSICGLAQARAHDKKRGGDGTFSCPTLGSDAIVSGIIPLSLTCGPFLKELRKWAPGILNLLAGFNLRGFVSSVPGDAAALISAAMVEIWVSYCETGKTSSIMMEHYSDLKSQYTYSYFKGLVENIQNYGLAGATNVNGANPLKLIAAMHYGAPKELHQLLLRVAYILDASDAFRRWLQGNGQAPPPRSDGLNPRDGIIADMFHLGDLDYDAGDLFAPDTTCPVIVIPNEISLNTSWLPCERRYVDLEGNKFTTGESLIVTITRAVTANGENDRAKQPPPGEGTVEWALTFPQKIIEDRFGKAIADKRKAEKEITLNTQAKELSVMPCGSPFYSAMRDQCPTRANPLFQKLFDRLTVGTNTTIDVRSKLWAMLTGHDEITGKAVLFDGKLGMQWLYIFSTHLLTHNVTQKDIDTARKEWGQLYERLKINRHGHGNDFPSYHQLTGGAAKSADEYCKMYPLEAATYREEHALCCGFAKDITKRREYLCKIRQVCLGSGLRADLKELL